MKKAEADWILQIDIVEQGDKLEVRKLKPELGFRPYYEISKHDTVVFLLVIVMDLLHEIPIWN